MRRHWTDRLSEYLDGGLSPDEQAQVEEHLGHCRECSDVLEGLRRVVETAKALENHEPLNDLWPGIARAIGSETPPEATVIELAERSGRPAPSPTPRRRRIGFTVPQLAAASLALIFVSGSAAWFLRPLTLPPSAVVADSAEETLVHRASAVVPSVGRYAEELIHLERMLWEHRGEIGASTLEVVEENLTVIDRAISDALRALETDPENRYLESHVERAYQRKVEYLRDATMLVVPRS